MDPRLEQAIQTHDNNLLENLLLRTDIDCNSPGEEGITALMMTHADQEATSILLANGADPNIADIEGITPLMIAAHFGNAEVTRILINNGANINATSFRGETALTAALTASLEAQDEETQQSTGRVADLLLTQGAEPTTEGPAFDNLDPGLQTILTEIKTAKDAIRQTINQSSIASTPQLKAAAEKLATQQIFSSIGFNDPETVTASTETAIRAAEELGERTHAYNPKTQAFVLNNINLIDFPIQDQTLQDIKAQADQHPQQVLVHLAVLHGDKLTGLGTLNLNDSDTVRKFIAELPLTEDGKLMTFSAGEFELNRRPVAKEASLKLAQSLANDKEVVGISKHIASFLGSGDIKANRTRSNAHQNQKNGRGGGEGRV